MLVGNGASVGEFLPEPVDLRRFCMNQWLDRFVQNVTPMDPKQWDDFQESLKSEDNLDE